MYSRRSARYNGGPRCHPGSKPSLRTTSGAKTSGGSEAVVVVECEYLERVAWMNRRIDKQIDRRSILDGMSRQHDVSRERGERLPHFLAPIRKLPEGFQNGGSCCGAVVFVDQSAELVAALDLAAGRWARRTCRVGREQRECAVRALAVVMGGVDA
jgi:hypothetical protein